MARFTVCLLALTLFTGQFSVEAAPLGKLKCSLARLRAAKSMNAASTAVDSMATLTANDPAMMTAVTQAQTCLANAQAAMQDPAASGAAADHSKDLTAAQAALDSITSGDKSILSRLKNVKARLAQAAQACQAIADACGDNAASTASASSVDAAATATSTVDVTAAAATDSATATSVDTAAAAAATSDVAAPASSAAATGNGQTGTGHSAKAVRFGGERRQIGGIACNASRLKIVANIAAATGAVKKVATASSADATSAAAAQTAQDGLTSAKQAIGVIAAKLLTGQASPADARTQVSDGLNAAKTALTGITSTDPAVTKAVTAAQSKVDASIAAGEGVLANC